MSGEGFDVRIYCLHSDGTIEALIGADTSHFQGAVPNVGDTYAKWGLDDVYRFYSVQRRYFVDSVDNDHGWCVVVREVESAPQMETVVKEWSEETRFWRELDKQEQDERDRALREELTKLTRKKKSKKPKSQAEDKSEKSHAGPKVNGNLAPILRYMVNHPLCTSPDVIPGAGLHRMEQLTELGALVEVERDVLGQRSWQLTDFGRSCVSSETVVHRKLVKTKRPRKRRP